MENNELVDILSHMSISDMRAEFTQLAEELFSNASRRIKPSELGLDKRTARYIWRGPKWLALRRSELASAQYYGGLEYVDEEYVLHFGDYMFFSTDDSRIAAHWSRLEDSEEHEELD